VKTGAGWSAARVKRYIEAHYGDEETGWYQHVTGVSLSGATTTVKTDIPDDAAGKELAHNICWNLIGTITGVTDVVRVLGPGAVMLEKCVP
jgi:hypothetical protein